MIAYLADYLEDLASGCQSEIIAIPNDAPERLAEAAAKLRALDAACRDSGTQMAYHPLGSNGKTFAEELEWLADGLVSFSPTDHSPNGHNMWLWAGVLRAKAGQIRGATA